jgi:hypothetical protein
VRLTLTAAPDTTTTTTTTDTTTTTTDTTPTTTTHVNQCVARSHKSVPGFLNAVHASHAGGHPRFG